MEGDGREGGREGRRREGGREGDGREGGKETGGREGDGREGGKETGGREGDGREEGREGDGREGGREGRNMTLAGVKGLGTAPVEADGLRDLMGDAVAISVMTLTKDTGNIPSLVPILPFIQSWSTFSRVVIISPVTKLSSESLSPSKSNRASHLPVPACN